MKLLHPVWAILLFLAGVPAFGICVSTTYRPVAWSADGDAVLIYEEARGPEGGGSVSYIVINFRKTKSETFALSSTFSQGEDYKPETITEDACRATLAKADQRLTELGFEARFESGPKTCKKDR